jgi:hypothetical protein
VHRVSAVEKALRKFAQAAKTLMDSSTNHTK